LWAHPNVAVAAPGRCCADRHYCSKGADLRGLRWQFPADPVYPGTSPGHPPCPPLPGHVQEEFEAVNQDQTTGIRILCRAIE
jgi:hypothetical protein